MLYNVTMPVLLLTAATDGTAVVKNTKLGKLIPGTTATEASNTGPYWLPSENMAVTAARACTPTSPSKVLTNCMTKPVKFNGCDTTVKVKGTALAKPWITA